MHSLNNSTRRKSSQRTKRSRAAGKLTIDTTFTSLGRAFPSESRVQELSFVSFEESKARKKAHAQAQQAASRTKTAESKLIEPNSKRSLPPPISPGQLDLGSAAVLKDGPSRYGPVTSASSIQKSAQGSLTLPPLHSRIKGLRPSPLDLNKDISPSDRAITIGIALSPSTISNYTKSPSPILPHSSPPEPRFIRDPKTGQEIATPRIVITPAKEHFSPSEICHTTGYRPASSVYSRYTTGAPRSAQNGRTPPVPPLPLFVTTKPATTHDSRVSTATVFEEDAQSDAPSILKRVDFQSQDSGDSNKREIRDSRPLTAGLPTPRRSKGWWNIITSPFSAKTPTFWRSPPLREEDAEPILSDAASMGASDSHAGVIFTNRAPGDTELRSAPASGVDVPAKDELTRRMPKRSDTAPGAIDPDSSIVNIYRIPRTGEAAAYYNPNRHFPSLYLQSRSLDKDDDLAGWSPSHSVFIPLRESRSPEEIGRSAFSPDTTMSADDNAAKHITMESAKEGDVADVASRDAASQNPSNEPTMFSTPSEEELKDAGLSRAPPQRALTQVTMDTMMSPLSATPVVEDAHVATMMGPQSSRGEQREVKVEPAPSPSQYGLGYATLGAATISHGEESREVKSEVPVVEKPPQRPPHLRQDSHGLGISDGERDLFSPPQMLSEKPRLGTDRFGQLTIRSDEEKGPTEPWYRCFFWFLAFVVAALLTLLIVLMVIFIPQRHNDINVQATWVDLTGFPPLVTGISTIIQPNKTDSRDTCVQPSGMWSCAAPPTKNDAVGDGLPNFRLEIRFRNGTLPSNETALVRKKRSQETSRRHRFIRRDSNPWTSYLYTPSPSPPSQSDQEFLGRTTDNITAAPYNGEQTPFFLSLLDPIALAASSSTSSKLHKRTTSNFSYPYPTPASASDTTASHNASTASADDIPSAHLQSNGQPVPQTLHPLVTAQPLRLFDRGLDSEHYGFYTYFDRSIYTVNVTVPPSDNSSRVAFDSNVALENATAVCTFSQTRMRVQIWTKRGTVSSLNATEQFVKAVNSTANNMEAPGSFPYPITITLDRHGGNAEKKGVYCYGLDAEKHIVDSEKVWIDEDRGIGGNLVNPAQAPSGNSTSAAQKRDSNDSDGQGIDGGTGGCGCTWQSAA